jgi:hypothetical protein
VNLQTRVPEIWYFGMHCPWLLAETKVATILGIFVWLGQG